MLNVDSVNEISESPFQSVVYLKFGKDGKKFTEILPPTLLIVYRSQQENYRT